MISRIDWPETKHGGVDPFTDRQSKDLQFTFHDTSFANADRDQKLAIEILYELSCLDEISIFRFEDGPFPQILISDTVKNDYFPISVFDSKINSEISHTGMHISRSTEARISSLLAQGGLGYEGWDFNNLRTEIMCLEAHRAIRRHLFVTCSGFFLALRSYFDHANVFDPVEALRVAGIYLRARDIWTYPVGNKTKVKVAPSQLFYRAINERIPSYEKYVSAFHKAKPVHGESLLDFGISIGEKCYRALQTLDKIATLFYSSQNNITQDGLLYYFDYLTLLLVGTFDSFANICDLVYEIGETHPSFRKSRFEKKLISNGGKAIAKVIYSSRGENLQKLLHSLRNNIHNVLMPAVKFLNIGKPNETFGVLSETKREDVWAAALALGGPLNWGLTRRDFSVSNPVTKVTEHTFEIYLEPYSYARMLTEQWFDMFEEMLRAIEFEAIFKSKSIPALGTPEAAFSQEVEDRLLLLAL